jgi:hypothetical protein
MTQLAVLRREPLTDKAPASAVPVAAASAWSEWIRFALLAAQFGLLVWLVRLFELENRFGDLLVLAWIGFVIHHLLPSRLRMPFFVLLSFGGLYLVAHGTIAVCVVAGGLVLIGICHLPIPFLIRVGLLLLAGGVLAALRGEWLTTPISSGAWMILGSFFMFRLIIYVYDLRHQAPVGAMRAMAYFFMLPNVCFPLFPVVDYKTFCATYFNEQPFRIYQRGLSWIFRGIIHLLLYRVVYQLIMVNPLEANNLGDVARFVTGSFLIYLRVSGQFHMIIGLMHLFGFNLPETHHLYFLASSFTDLWRRINIYWKDFIMKIFFYPTYFRVKGLGPIWAMSLATLVAFFATWLFHAYQWFWIRGSFLFTWQEAVFWWLLAVLLWVNLLYESSHGRQRALGKPRRTIRSELGRALRTIAVFVAMCLLWTAWGAHSFEELSWLARSATHVTPGSLALVLTGLVGLGLAAVLFGHSSAERSARLSQLAQPTKVEATFSWRSALATGLPSCALLLLAFLPRIHPLEGAAGDIYAAISQEQLNQNDADTLRRGYYERLDVARIDDKLAFLARAAPPQWETGHDQFGRRTDDFMMTELVPTRGPVEFHGTPLTINRWGMRDRDYEKIKPTGVCRIAMLGSSFEFGSGVADNETFENLVEDRLNSDRGHRAYEILNFAEPGFSAVQYVGVLERRALTFEPDAVLVMVNANEFARTIEHGAKVLHKGLAMPYDILANVARLAGLEPGMSEDMIRARLKPFARQIVAWALERMAQQCRRRGIALYMVYRPSVIAWSKQAAEAQVETRRQLLELAQELRLATLDMSATFDGVKNRRELVVAAWDEHANAKGHQLLANELYKLLHDSRGNVILEPRTEGLKRNGG